MTYISVPTFALLANQDLSFQLVLGVAIFILLNSMTWAAATASSASVRVISQNSTSTAPGIADPEEDYLPREYQKPGPTPAEMEAFCPWSGVDVTEWQEILYDGHRLHA